MQEQDAQRNHAQAYLYKTICGAAIFRSRI